MTTKILYEHLKILGRQSQPTAFSQDSYFCNRKIVSDNEAVKYYNENGLTLCNKSDIYIVFLKKYIDDKIFKQYPQNVKKDDVYMITSMNNKLNKYNSDMILAFNRYCKSKAFNLWFNLTLEYQIRSLKVNTLINILQLSLKHRFDTLKKFYLFKREKERVELAVQNRLLNVTKLLIHTKIRNHLITWYDNTVNYYNCPYGQYSGNYHNYLGYYGNYAKGIKLEKNNMLKCKIGVTERKPKDRQKEYPNDFEMKLVLRVKHNMESEIVKELKKLKYIYFSERSNEEFLCPFNKYKNVQELFFNITNKYTI